MEYILTNFMLYVKGNFKNVTIDLAMGYKLTNFWLAEEAKKKLHHQCL
jgi:hypothetical protein